MPSAASQNRPGGRTTPAPPANPSSYLKYPRDLSEGNGDYVEIKFYKYSPPYAGGNQSTGGTTKFIDAYNGVYATGENGSSKLSPADGFPTISLYMPEDLSTSYSNKWGGRQFGPFAPLALGIAGGIMGAATQDAAKGEASKFTQSIPGFIQGAIPYIGATLVSSAMNAVPGFGGSVSANDILATTRGEILNPNTEVLYQGPELRTFSLNFKMLARNKKESVDIRKICHYCKQASLPTGKSDTPNLISVPKIVGVTFKHKGELHPYISQFKISALGNVDIKYTADGAWASYTDGAPVAVELGLQFQELKLVYSEDVKDGPGSF